MGSARVLEWKRETEERLGGPIVEVRVEPGAAYPPLLRQLLKEASMAELLGRAHALSVHYRGPEGNIHYILFNIALEPEWGPFADALLAHEIGHAWLNVSGYPSPPFRSGPDACVPVLATDIVQHILIREQAVKRGIDMDGYWLSNLTKTLENIENAGDIPHCEKLTQLTHFMDAQLGFTEGRWPPLKRLRSAFAKVYPDLTAPAKLLEDRLGGARLDPGSYYENALTFTLDLLQRVLS
jgi:hypothetical protein